MIILSQSKAGSQSHSLTRFHFHGAGHSLDVSQSQGAGSSLAFPQSQGAGLSLTHSQSCGASRPLDASQSRVLDDHSFTLTQFRGAGSRMNCQVPGTEKQRVDCQLPGLRMRE